MRITPRIVPCLWFHDHAEDAARYYVDVFGGRIRHVTRYGAAASAQAGRPEGSVLTVEFEIGDQPFTALNGGPAFTMNEAVSFQVMCKDQAEIDHYWARLTDGGEESVCGWLKDRYGVSWQVVPEEWITMATSRDAAAVERAMTALLAMRKLDVAALRDAFTGRA